MGSKAGRKPGECRRLQAKRRMPQEGRRDMLDDALKLREGVRIFHWIGQCRHTEFWRSNKDRSLMAGVD